MDWGFRHASSIHWHTTGDVSPEEAKAFGKSWDVPRKCVFTYREQIAELAENRDGIGDEETLGRKIVSLSKDEKISRMFLSSDAFGKKSSQRTPAEMLGHVLRSGGLPYPEMCDMSPGSRVTGWPIYVSAYPE